MLLVKVCDSCPPAFTALSFSLSGGLALAIDVGNSDGRMDNQKQMLAGKQAVGDVRAALTDWSSWDCFVRC